MYCHRFSEITRRTGRQRSRARRGKLVFARAAFRALRAAVFWNHTTVHGVSAAILLLLAYRPADKENRDTFSHEFANATIARASHQAHQSPRARKVALPAAARAQSRGLVCVGRRGVRESARENKPIFLSIGYSTCHWCHVMERESFENEEIGEFLNEHFVSIKVDREERPDVDKIYMTFVQAMTGSGGWPLNVFLTPELQAVLRRNLLAAGSEIWPAEFSASAAADRRARGSRSARDDR